MVNDNDSDDGTPDGSHFTQSIQQESPSNQNSVEDDGATSGTSSSSAMPGDRYRHRLGLSELQWTLVVSLALALPYPVLFYLFFTGELVSLPLLFVTLLYSLIAIYIHYKL